MGNNLMPAPSYKYVDTWEQLGTNSSLTNTGSELTNGLVFFSPGGYFGGGPSICKGPDGQPWCAIVNMTYVGDPNAAFDGTKEDGARGPFVSKWNGSAWVGVSGPNIDGGIGRVL